MTRIVAGLAKGRRLRVPAQGTRPTSDRAREALFNTLASRVDLDGVHMLDLFAGSGAVGLEALSRGAASVLFVEADRRAAEVLQRNIDTVGLPGARVARRPVEAVLDGNPAHPAELVFADPPYELDERRLAAVLTALVANGWLAADALVVVERSARGREPHWPHGIELITHRRYGEGVLWYGRRQS